MSKFTTELRYICENYSGLTESTGYNDVESIIAECADWIFGDFPIYDEEYRDILERKIIRHYYTREISEETVGLWRLRVNDKMNIIMPYYNQLYKSTLLEFNPFYDVDLTRDYKRKDDGSEGKIENETSDETGTKNLGEINTGITSEKSSNKTGESNIESEATKEKNSGENNTNYGEISVESDERKEIGNNGEIETKNSKSNKEAQETETRNLATHKEGEETETRNLADSKIKSGSESDSVDKWDLYSDTPQGGVVGIVNAGAESVGSNAYLTNARHITDSGSKTFNNVTERGTDTGTVTKESEESGTDTGTISRVSEENGTDSGSTSKQGNFIGSSEGKNSASKNSANKEEFNRNSDVSRSKTSGKMTNTENESSKSDQNTKSATEGTKLDRSSQRVGQSVISNMSEYIEHVIGKQGGHSYSKMLLEFRETMLNIDAMIIKELETLFFGLWE